MAEFLIRPMRRSDYDDYVRFYSQLHRIHFEGRPDIFREAVSVQPQEIYEQDLQKPNHQWIGAELEGKLVGFCDLQLQIIPDDPALPLCPMRSAHIENLFVVPSCRRQGAATLLYREAVRRAKAMGAEKVTLMVWSFNETALRFYEKLGLTPMFLQMETRELTQG